jgi:predicted nucleic acid-binding protein
MTRTYLDAGVLIEAARPGATTAGAALGVLTDAERVFVSSVFLRLEVEPKPLFFQRWAEAAVYAAFFDRVVAWAESVDAICADALRLATRYGLNGMDALHVAAALALGADELVTTERPTSPLLRVAAPRVVSIHPSAGSAA